MAVVGRAMDGEARVEPSPPRQAGSATSAPGEVAIASAPAGRSSSVIVLDVPADSHQLISTQAIVVRGHLLHETAFLQVLFQSRSAGFLLLKTVRPMTAPPDNDRSEGTAFVATLPLPDPRPSGPATIQIVAYDTRGRARDTLVRPIQIGPLLDPTYGGMAGRPPTGEDGLMGGIPFGTNIVPHDNGD